VGAGSVLRDLIESKAVPTATLTEIKRNKGEIVTGCHAIMKGKLKLPASSPLSVATGHNWRHLELDEPAEIIAQVVTLATEWATGRGIALKDLIVISPFNHRNKRDMSCQDFNIRLQEFRNPPAAGKTEMSGGIRIGDRVVRLANKVYKDAISGLDVPVVNGDLGMVENITGDHLTVLFESPERRIEMKRGEAELALAYALTCHKMQGSEARLVILPVHKSFGPFPNREWIYTAMSRAKELLVTVGQADALDYWVSRTGIGLRKTNLKKFMAGKDGAK
jgi:exodeoxyribonuclease V alpha subunit